jgi:hypothetical protein
MKAQSKLLREWYFDGLGDFADFTVTGDANVAVNDDGLLFDVDTATEESLLSFGAIQPYLLSDLKYVDFIFKMTAREAETEYAFGITANASASKDIDAHTHLAFLRVSGATSAVTLGYDNDTTTNLAIATGKTLSLDEWYYLRLDFAQEYSTVSPPATSKGSQMTAHLTDGRGFQSRVSGSVAVDMHASRAIKFAPFVHAALATGGSASECELLLRYIGLETLTPQ